MSNRSLSVSRLITKKLLGAQGLETSTWAETYPNAYTALLEHEADIELQIRRELNKVSRALQQKLTGGLL